MSGRHTVAVRRWRINMKGRAFQSVRLYPLNSPFEHVRSIVIEAEHKAAINLNAIAMEYGDAAGVVLGSGGPLAGIGEVAAIQRLETLRGLIGTGQHMQPTEYDATTLAAVPVGKLIGAPGESQMHGNADYMGQRMNRWRTLKHNA
jgi:hypothetical protein